MFLPVSSIGLLATNRAYLHLANPTLQEVFISKLTQFSKGNNVLDACACNTDGFPWRDKHVSSTQLNRPISKNTIYLHLEQPKVQ
jgi:hypothetical protein